MFRLNKTEFDYKMMCLKYVRVRSPIRSINWKWSQENKKGIRDGLIVLGDNEEGLSVFVYEEKLKDLKLKAFDIEAKSIIYAGFIKR